MLVLHVFLVLLSETCEALVALLASGKVTERFGGTEQKPPVSTQWPCSSTGIRAGAPKTVFRIKQHTGSTAAQCWDTVMTLACGERREGGWT